MSLLHAFHLGVLSIWFGLVIAETAIEFVLKDDQIAAKAKLHFWIDVCAEIPVVLAVLVSGILLARAVPVLTSLHWIKIGLALFAIADNLFCAVMVQLRYFKRADGGALKRYDTLVRWTFVGVPAGLGALAIGLVWFT